MRLARFELLLLGPLAGDVPIDPAVVEPDENRRPDHDRDRQDHRDEQNFRSQEIVHWSSLSSTLLPSKCRPTAAESQIAAFTISTVLDTFVATSPRLMNTATSGPMTPTVKLEPAAAFSALALSLIFSSRAFDTSKNPFVAPLLEQATTPPW